MTTSVDRARDSPFSPYFPGVPPPPSLPAKFPPAMIRWTPVLLPAPASPAFPGPATTAPPARPHTFLPPASRLAHFQRKAFHDPAFRQATSRPARLPITRFPQPPTSQPEAIPANLPQWNT